MNEFVTTSESRTVTAHEIFNNNDYEESFYYDKSSSICSDISGEAIGLGLLFYLLTYRFEWNEPVYIIGVIAIVSVSMMLQHIFKVFRILYGIFTCVAVSLFVSVFIGYSTDANMYKTMAICFGVTAVWTTISWKCILNK